MKIELVLKKSVAQFSIFISEISLFKVTIYSKSFREWIITDMFLFC